MHVILRIFLFYSPRVPAAMDSQQPPNVTGTAPRHAGTAPGQYSFPSVNQTKFEFTDHLRSFACKISGRPRPQYRNFATTKGSATKVKMFSPSKNNQNSFRSAFQQALQHAPEGLFRCNDNPCAITVKFYFPRPKKHFALRPQGQDWPLKANSPKLFTHAPDVDNCVKLVLDALQGTAFKNDSCVVQITASKLYDHTQLLYRDGVDYVGTTLIKVVEIDPNTAPRDCKCFHCS